MSKHIATFGSISTGTLLPSDLIPAFCDELRALRGAVPAGLWRDARRAMASESVMDDIGPELLSDLIDALNEFAPAYGYFGAHPGDGADFGFWLADDFEQVARDDGALFVLDTSAVPAGYSGEVVHVNDHGNVTLYAARNGQLREIWAVV